MHPRAVAVAFIILVSSAVYANTLLNGFVYDDIDQILNNRWITDISNLPGIFSSSVWAFLEQQRHFRSNYYRPMMYAVYILEYSIFGLNPMGWHLINIIIHAANSVLVFFIASFFFRKDPLKGGVAYPLFAALVFSTHPVNTEVVAWIACIPELSFTFFYLLSFYTYMKYMERDGTRPYRGLMLLSTISFFLAALFKETALSLPLLIIVYDRLKGRLRLKTLPDDIKRYAPYAAVCAVYLLLRFNALGGMAPKEFMHPYLSAFQYVINVFPLFIKYMRYLLLPVKLVQSHPLEPVYSVLEAGFLVSVLLLGLLALAFYRLKRVDPHYILYLSLTIIPLLPALYIPGLSRNTFAERYLYLPSAGFAFILSLSLERVSRFLSERRTIPAGAVTAVIFSFLVLYCYGTVKRNFEWRNSFTLWESAVHKDPDNYFALGILGELYMDNGLIDRAVPVLKRSIEVNSRRRDPDPLLLGAARLMLADAYHRSGMPDEAIAQYREVLKMNPNRSDAYYNIGLIYFEKGLVDEAIASYKEAAKFYKDPSDLKDLYNNLGNAYAKKGLFDKAIESYRYALLMVPGDPVVLRNLEIVERMARRAHK